MTNDESRVPPERLAEAQRLCDAAGPVSLPYPSREATDFLDAVLLRVVENLSDPQWIAEHWLNPDWPEPRR